MPMPYGGGSYPGQPAPYQPGATQGGQQVTTAPPATFPTEPAQPGRKSGDGQGVIRGSGQYSAFQGVSELPDSAMGIETAQSPPPGDDRMRIGQGLRVVNQ